METQLKFNKTASDWIDALPMGNGRIGAMVYGRPQDEIISLNEDTLWSGEYRDRRNHACLSHLDEIRSMIFAGNYAGANRSIIDNILGDNSFQYMPLGDLMIHLDTTEVTGYSRTLDLRKAVSSTMFESCGIGYYREVLVSKPDQVMAVRQSCNQPGGISMKIRLVSFLHNEINCEGKDLVMDGMCPSEGWPESNPTPNPFIYTDRGVRFEARVRAISKGGSVKVLRDVIEIKNADEVVIFFAVRTSYQKYCMPLKAEYSCKEDLERAEEKGYFEIRRQHEEDVTNLFDRIELDLNDDVPESINTDEMICEFSRTGRYAAGLARLKFHLARYLLIACSRPGTQPANLQGIWNKRWRAKWSSNYTLNINTQMNYMAAPVLNLPECQEPLDRLLEDLAEDGAITAREMYGLDGWVTHHNTDLWRLTSPPGHLGELCEKKASVSGTMGHGPVRYGMWPMGGAWLCRHIWEKYLHTMDLQYLASMYPIMKGAAVFMLGFLVEHNGKLVTCPSTSPENEFKAYGGTFAGTYGSTCDIAILRDLFSNCISAQELLGKDETYEQLKDALKRLPPYSVGKFGQILEWQEDFEETEVAHRHLSHLYGVFPANNMPDELMDAVKVTMERRGDRATAWEAAWRAAIWARLKDGERAFKVLRQQMVTCDPINDVGGHGGCLVNLTDSAPPFQIDGTLGFPAAIAEMLIQSHRGKIELLPAVPKAFGTGKLRGFIVRGGISVSMEWENCSVVSAELCSVREQDVCISMNGTEIIVHLSAGQPRRV